MKLKALTLSVAVAACMFTANAQTAQKTSHDIFVGLGAGISSVMVPGFSTPAFYANIFVGKWITPVWGVRAVVGGPFQTVKTSALCFDGSYDAQGIDFKHKNKGFAELNADVMFNFSNLGNIDLAKFDCYLFLGPTLTFASAGSSFTGEPYVDPNGYLQGSYVEEDNTFKVKAGATVGLGLSYNITRSFALGLEGRYAVSPSIFGDADKYRKGEGTMRFAVTGIWNINGKRGKAERAIDMAHKYGYLTADEAQAMVDEALAKNPRVIEKPVEKIVEKIVETGTAVAPAATAVFFEIGKAVLTNKDKVRIKLYADAIKAGSKDVKYEVAGYADKGTGSAATNQKISQKRADVVYDALVAEGVDPSQLVKSSYGGVENMYYNTAALSRTTVVRVK